MRRAHAVECAGQIIERIPVDAQSGAYTLTIGECAPILGDCHLGDSIAVNGAEGGATTDTRRVYHRHAV